MENKRQLIMLAVVVLLIIANLLVRMGGGGFEGGGLFDDDDPQYTPRLQRVVADLERLPVLDFTTAKPAAEVDIAAQRNPFIFGVDKREEAKRQSIIEDLEKQRVEAEKARQAALAAAPPEPEKPAFTGRVIGVMRDSRLQTARISIAHNNEIFILNTGDLFDTRWRFVAVENESVRFQNIEDGQEITLNIDAR